MNTATQINLEDIRAIMEQMVKSVPGLPLKSQVDVAARLRAIAKHCETIDKAVKAAISEKLNGGEGDVKGEIFKAHLALVDTTRLDQALLKQEKPKIYEQYLTTHPQQRITFEPR